MTHKQEDIDAAVKFAKQYHEKTEQKESVAKSCFLAGIEHKRKEIDELVDMLKNIKDYLGSDDRWSVEQLIQKHSK